MFYGSRFPNHHINRWIKSLTFYRSRFPNLHINRWIKSFTGQGCNDGHITSKTEGLTLQKQLPGVDAKKDRNRQIYKYTNLYICLRMCFTKYTNFQHGVHTTKKSLASPEPSSEIMPLASVPASVYAYVTPFLRKHHQ